MYERTSEKKKILYRPKCQHRKKNCGGWLKKMAAISYTADRKREVIGKQAPKSTNKEEIEYL